MWSVIVHLLVILACFSLNNTGEKAVTLKYEMCPLIFAKMSFFVVSRMSEYDYKIVPYCSTKRWGLIWIMDMLDSTIILFKDNFCTTCIFLKYM